jgi:hypothetical protein
LQVEVPLHSAPVADTTALTAPKQDPVDEALCGVCCLGGPLFCTAAGIPEYPVGGVSPVVTQAEGSALPTVCSVGAAVKLQGYEPQPVL